MSVTKNGPEQRASGHEVGGAWDKFLTPEAMLTPGAAGGITMLISNALANNIWGNPSYIGLAISFLFGSLVLASSSRLPISLRAIYYILNSLIIFCVAFGSGNLVASKGHGSTSNGSTSMSLFSPAYADESSSDFQALLDKYSKINSEYKNKSATLDALQKKGAPQAEIDAQNKKLDNLKSQRDESLKSLYSKYTPKGKEPEFAGVVPETVGRTDNFGNSFFKPWTNPFTHLWSGV